MKKKYPIQLAGIPLTCDFHFPETADFFKTFYSERHQGENIVSVSDRDKNFWKITGTAFDAYAEYSLLTAPVSDALLKNQCCIMHAAAFTYAGQAYLITGPSGVGKTTQLRSLQSICHDQITVICGDRPVIKIEESGCITVHPSPWNGKEGLYGSEIAPLAGIICLYRGQGNRILSLKKKDAVIPVYKNLIHSGENEAQIIYAAKFAEVLLNNIPVWQLTSFSVPDSTHLLYKHILRGGAADAL